MQRHIMDRLELLPLMTQGIVLVPGQAQLDKLCLSSVVFAVP